MVLAEAGIVEDVGTEFDRALKGRLQGKRRQYVELASIAGDKDPFGASPLNV